jgi:hypothetical protein
MYQGEHMNNGGAPKARKTATLLVAIVLLLGVAVGTTVAYLIDRTTPIENKFEYAKTDVTVEETLTGTEKSNVQVKNNSNIPVYIRATYVVSWVDANGNIVTSVPAGYSYQLTENPDSKWVEGKDGYFYYPTPVQPKDLTGGSLLTCTVTYPANPEYTLNVEILATAIQSEPKDAVKEAWGVTVDADGNLQPKQ